jgi:hypothetical protein
VAADGVEELCPQDIGSADVAYAAYHFDLLRCVSTIAHER